MNEYKQPIGKIGFVTVYEHDWHTDESQMQNYLVSFAPAIFGLMSSLADVSLAVSGLIASPCLARNARRFRKQAEAAAEKAQGMFDEFDEIDRTTILAEGTPEFNDAVDKAARSDLAMVSKGAIAEHGARQAAGLS